MLANLNYKHRSSNGNMQKCKILCHCSEPISTERCAGKKKRTKKNMGKDVDIGLDDVKEKYCWHKIERICKNYKNAMKHKRKND